ncbi:MAG: hypothetical protein RQ728_06170 [Brevefilum sp.]|nr:hypothetical protein [Brevefilum sp.]MDT8381825.1 hypothetical protein [Brevefilum sp.]
MRNRLLITFLVTFILGIVTMPQIVYAFPPLPASFYGVVTKNGANLPEGITIMAVINNKVYAGNTVKIYEGESVYSLVVPGDDPTTDVIEGGVQGDTIYFNVDGILADQTATWQSGSSKELDLTVSSTVIEPTYIPTATPTNKPTTASTRTNTPTPTRTQTAAGTTQVPQAATATSTLQLTTTSTQASTEQLTLAAEQALTSSPTITLSLTLMSSTPNQLSQVSTPENNTTGVFNPVEVETTAPSESAQEGSKPIGWLIGIPVILMIVLVSGFLYFRKNDSQNDLLL